MLPVVAVAAAAGGVVAAVATVAAAVVVDAVVSPGVISCWCVRSNERTIVVGVRGSVSARTQTTSATNLEGRCRQRRRKCRGCDRGSRSRCCADRLRLCNRSERRGHDRSLGWRCHQPPVCTRERERERERETALVGTHDHDSLARMITYCLSISTLLATLARTLGSSDLVSSAICISSCIAIENLIRVRA